MLSKEKFIIHMNNLLTYRQKQDERLEYLNKAFPDASSMIDEISERLFDQYVHFLSVEVDDENDWISYYIFDNDCGKNKRSVELNNKKFKLDSIEKLWKVINYK
jgi:hypothetical protein